MNIELYLKKIFIFQVLNKFKFYQNKQNVFLKFNRQIFCKIKKKKFL